MDASLYTYSDFDVIWDSLWCPWFTAVLGEAWKQELPVVVICPNKALLSALKGRLAEEGLPSLGVFYMTPGSLRQLLVQKMNLGCNVALREDLHLLMRVAAEQDGGSGLTKALAMDPADLTKDCDRLNAAGWDTAAFSEQEVQAFSQRYQELIRDVGLSTVYEIDHRLKRSMETPQAHISYCLMIGFSSEHWAYYPLLSAACECAVSATVCLRHENESVSGATWLGSWEQFVGQSAHPFFSGEARERPYGDLVQAFTQNTNLTVGAKQPRLVVFKNAKAEAEGLMQQIQRWLSGAGKEQGEISLRIGVVFSRHGTVCGREFARLLTEADIPHHDLAGHMPERSANHALFIQWLAFQREPRLGTYLDFLRELVRLQRMDKADYIAHEKRLLKNFQETISEDLRILASYRNYQSDLLQDWVVLPAMASFSEFLEQCMPQLEAIAWPESLDILGLRAAPYTEQLRCELSKAAFLEWLIEVVNVPGRTRATIGRQPFAPIQLVTYPEAVGQAWSHLILAGLAEGEWPSVSAESSFLDDGVVASLNKDAVEDGSQGEGHQTIKPGHVLIETNADRQSYAEKCFVELLRAPSDALVVSTALSQSSDFSRRLSPGQLFMGLARAISGEYPDEEALALLQEAAPQREYQFGFPEVGIAWNKRNDPSQPFDEFSYGFKEGMPVGVSLSCKAWEGALNAPAHTWYSGILKLRPPCKPSDEDLSALAKGTWVHKWLNLDVETGSSSFQSISAKGYAEQVIAKAAADKQLVHRAYASAGRPIPDWWLSLWQQARCVALQLAAELCEANAKGCYASEVTVKNAELVVVPNVLSMSISGRIDLIVARQSHCLDLSLVESRNEHVTVVDFKTGNYPKLSKRGVSNGSGIQMALYGLALRALGYQSVSISVLSPEMPFTEQMTVDDVLEIDEIWSALAHINRTGKFGDRGNAKDLFSYSGDYPLANIVIPEAVLEKKWALTHAK